MKITKSQIKRWRNLLREIPVSVNNFYGDPTIQWEDTLDKLKNLAATKHRGPVGVITKGKLTDKHAKELLVFIKKGLKIILFISISELRQFEKVGMDHRYANITLLNKYKIPVIAYIRPMTPPYNTSPEIIQSMFAKLHQAGAKFVVASGFRGDDALVKDMAPDEKIKWVMRVKIMTGEVYQLVKAQTAKYGMKLFTRTSCAVSALLKDKTTYNPYYYSPNLVKCAELDCPIRSTCQPVTQPKKHALEFIKFLGYQVELLGGCSQTKCFVEPDKRLDCPSCCTTCYRLNVPRLLVKGNIKLGDLTFIRFITGMLAMQPGRSDAGDKDVGNINLPNFPEIDNAQCLNTWWPYARVGDKCFECSYCVEKYYGSARRDYGFPPAELIDKILKINQQKICAKNFKSISQPVRLVANIAS